MRSEPYTTEFSSVAEETCHHSLELPPLLWTAGIMIQKVNHSGMFTLKICCLRLSVSRLKGNSLCIHPQIFLEIKHSWWIGILTFKTQNIELRNGSDYNETFHSVSMRHGSVLACGMHPPTRK